VVFSRAIIACNYFRIFAGLLLSISGCDVTSKMSADEKLLLLSAAAISLPAAMPEAQGAGI